MSTNPDFRDLFSALCDEGADFLVVGAHAVMYYTEPRYTKDLDVWVRPERGNAERVHVALRKFGAPMADLGIEDLGVPGTIFQIGVAPNRIDVLTSIEGLSFDDAWPKRVESTYGGVSIALLSLDDLLTNKRAVARPQDLLDVQKLERAAQRR
jgi:hypothetical protein